jgi:hypothetical protein
MKKKPPEIDQAIDQAIDHTTIFYFFAHKGFLKYTIMIKASSVIEKLFYIHRILILSSVFTKSLQFNLPSGLVK